MPGAATTNSPDLGGRLPFTGKLMSPSGELSRSRQVLLGLACAGVAYRPPAGFVAAVHAVRASLPDVPSAECVLMGCGDPGAYGVVNLLVVRTGHGCLLMLRLMYLTEPLRHGWRRWRGCGVHVRLTR